LKTLSKLLLCILISEAAGLIVIPFIDSGMSPWYASLVKPALNPPNWLFGPVWTVLYALMGLAAFLIWRRGLQTKGVKHALGHFLIQLVLNALWTVIFFGLHRPGLALIEIVVLWLAILFTIIIFRRISRPAAWLMMPYIAWVSVAAYLNASIWFLNR
jgi:tryptophan-rich sensory protein